MDTMTLTKAAAGFCGAFLVFLLGKWAADELYHVGGHGEAAYVVEVEEAGGDDAAEEVNFDELYAEADVAKGEKVFKKCTACHKAEDGANSTGPFLYGVVDRPIASVAGFGYSGTLSGMSDKAWTTEELDAFLAKPSSYAKGTSMSFSGLKKQSDRINVIAYLDSLDN